MRAPARPAGCITSPCVDQSKCQACAECPPMDMCPSRVIKRLTPRGRVQVTTLEGCYGCLACVTACPFEAVWAY